MLDYRVGCAPTNIQYATLSFDDNDWLKITVKSEKTLSKLN